MVTSCFQSINRLSLNIKDYFFQIKAVAITFEFIELFSIVVGIWAGTKTVSNVPTIVEVASAIKVPLISIAPRRRKVRR